MGVGQYIISTAARVRLYHLAVEPALEQNLRGVSHEVAQPVRLAPQSLPLNNQSDL